MGQADAFSDASPCFICNLSKRYVYKVINYEIVNWLTNIANSESPLDEIIAFNIGLFEGDDGYIAYLIGSKTYDADNDDWACNEDFVPVNKYHSLQGSSGKERDEVVSEVIAEVKEFLHTANSTFSNANAVTVGFDDGDLVKVTM